MFEKLTEIISNYVEVEPSDVKPESRFMEDLRFTSFDFMSMLGEIEDEMDVEIDQEEALSAPVEAGQPVGRMTVVSGGETLASIPIVADQAVARLTYWQIFQRCLRLAFCGGMT